MADLISLYNFARQGADEGKARGIQSLIGKAAANPADRQKYLGMAAQSDPRAAFDAQKYFADDDGRKRTEVAKRVSVLMSMPQEQRAQMYASMAPEFQAMGIPAPAQYDPSFDEPMRAIAQAYGGGAAANGVQSTYVDAQGNRVAILRDGSTQVLGQNAPQVQLIEGQGGYYGVNKTNLQAAPVQIGQPGITSAQPRAPGEVPFSIDPAMPPEVQASIRANESQWAAAPDGASMPIGTPGSPMGAVGVGGMAGQLRPAEKQPSSTFVPLNSDEVAAMGLPAGTVAQRNLQTGQVYVINKPDAREGAGDEGPKLSAGEAAKVRRDFKETRDALNLFMAFGKALDETPSGPGLLVDGAAKGRLGTAYNNARASLRILYNTGVLQPGELPMLENALRDPTSVTAVLDYRTRPQIKAQLDELYRTIDRSIQNQVASYPQVFDPQRFEQARQRQQAAPTGGVDDLLTKYGAR